MLLFALLVFASLFRAVLAQGSPSDYAPTTNLSCPNITFVRSDGNISAQEVAYINSRQANVLSGWNSWIGNGSQIGYNFSSFQGSNNSSGLPKVGIAVSGGGYRAAQYGAGVVSALDARNSTSVQSGTGGLFQISSYLTGLSGGSWFVSSLVFNDLPTIPDLVFGNQTLSGWQLYIDLLRPDPNNETSFDTISYYASVYAALEAKSDAGFPVSFTDAWGRAIGYHMFNGTTTGNFFANTSHGAGLLWSAIPQIPSFQQAEMPFPIVVATSRVSSNSTSRIALPITSPPYEFNPYEMGSWDPSLSSFADMKYVGTNFSSGVPINMSNCVNGFDQADFIIGTSANVFNEQFGPLLFNDTSGITGKIIDSITQEIQEIRNTSTFDVANWPNPFKGVNPTTYVDSSANVLSLVDGGEQLENIPLFPLMVKSRQLDVIVAVDASADTNYSWPDGAALYATQNRTQQILSNVSQQFPPLPTNSTDFVTWNLNQRPTFFGCDPTQSPPEWPLLIYLPNSPPLNGSAPVTNPPSLVLNQTLYHTSLFLDQTFLSTTQGFTPNSTAPDPNFGKCLQCAVVDRARLNMSPSMNRSEICTNCFNTYCFNPNSTTPPGPSVMGRSLPFVQPVPPSL